MTTDTGIQSGTATGLTSDTGADSGSDSGAGAGAKERAQQAASAATDQSKHVAGVAIDEASSVAAEAKAQAGNLVGEARSQLQGQLSDQGRQQKDMVASTLGSFGDDLASMAENGSGLAAQVAHEVADRAQSLSRHLEGREPGELLDDVRQFARQRPGTFLLGALAAGVVVGRLARGTKDAIAAADGAPSTGTSTGTSTGSSSGSGSIASAGESTASSAGLSGAGDDSTRRVTPGAPDTASVHAGHGQPTQPVDVGPASSTGYSSPPAGTGLAGAPDGGSAGGPQGGTS
jgi:hypothetical protein